MISRSAQDLPKLMMTFPTEWDRLLGNRYARNRNRKIAATEYYPEQLSNRIRSRNNTMAKPNQLSWFFINSSLQQRPIVEGR